MLSLRNTAAVAIVASMSAGALAQTQMGTAFTYQARLSDGGSLQTAPYDLRFKLFNNDGQADQTTGQIGPANTLNDVPVSQGLFSVVLDFGAVFAGDKRWLQIEIRPGDTTGAYTILLPRVEITGTPYANGLELPFAALQVPAGGANVFSITTDDARAGLFKNTLASTNFVALRAESNGVGGAIHGLMNSGGNGLAGWFQTLSPTATTSTFKAETFGLGQAAEFRVQNAANTGPSLYAATAGSGPALLADGRVQVGSSSTSGSLVMRRSGSGNDMLTLAATTGGGLLTLASSNGTPVFQAFNDTDSPAGQLSVARSAGNAGFIVDGNFVGSGNALVYVSGALRTAIFNTNAAGDASVVLPADAIDATETLDEPGLAENNSDSFFTIPPSTLGVVLSRTITPPADGYCLVIGTTEAIIGHTQGVNSQAAFGISPASDSLPATQQATVFLPASLPSGTYHMPVTVHGVFPASASSSTYFLLCNTNFSTSAQATQVELTACYFPTAYGPVGGGGGYRTDGRVLRTSVTGSEIAAERAASASINNARVTRELTRMQAEIDALKALVARDQNKSLNLAQPAPSNVPAEAPSNRDADPVQGVAKK